MDKYCSLVMLLEATSTVNLTFDQPESTAVNHKE